MGLADPVDVSWMRPLNVKYYLMYVKQFKNAMKIS